ncbi:MAG: CocE/NonD family hydrolase [Pseudomonadota bacterium]
MSITANQFSETPNLYIRLSDGRKLSARLWLPLNAEQEPVPAILEYLPYRKRDGTAQRDESTYPIFAQAGYAGVRVDISGTGESDGDFDDEYSPRELADGVEVIEWIAAQPWCDGNVGMMGISWGGFNSLQIAALQPPALKAVISIGSTVDRYNDDIHYKNGCLLYSNFWWSNVMLCFASRPPDPAIAGDPWRDMWIDRLKTQPFPLEKWLAHQRRDAYWQHGSINQDFTAVQMPALVISGWADGYINAPPAAAANLKHGRAINGPWIHKYPHFAYPHPRMDFHAEALQWWDRWLRGVQNDVDELPAYRAFISEGVRPSVRRETEAGRWVAEPAWPSPKIESKDLYLGKFGQITLDAPEPDQATICSPLDCGTASGEIFTLKPDADMQSDQRSDDAGSLCFDTDTLMQPVEILGRPVIQLRIAIDRPIGNVIVRLVDVHPDGCGFRVSWGVLNLAHRDSNENPKVMPSGQFTDVTIQLDECGYRFLPGHRLRIAISTAYWPMVMPPPDVITATIGLGEHSKLSLPIREGDDSHEVPEPENPDPLPKYTMHRESRCERRVDRDLQNQRTTYTVIDDTGEEEMPSHGLRTRHLHTTHYSIDWDDPLSACSKCKFTCWMSRDNWSIRTESESDWHCDASRYYISARVRAYENDVLFHERLWEQTIPRDLM